MFNPLKFFNATGKPAPDPIPPYVPPPHTPVDLGAKPEAEPIYTRPDPAAEQAAFTQSLKFLHPQKPEPAKPAPVVVKPAPKWTDGFSWYRPEVAFHPSREFMEEFSRRAKVVIFTQEEKTKLAELCEQKTRIFKEIETVGFDAARLLLNDIHVANAKKIEAGQMPEPVPDLENLKREFDVKRQHLRGQLRAILNSTRPIVAGMCTRLVDAAKTLAEKLQAEEQADSAKWGHPFTPSSALCALVWMADQGLMNQVNCMTGPDHLLFGLYNHADYTPNH